MFLCDECFIKWRMNVPQTQYMYIQLFMLIICVFIRNKKRYVKQSLGNYNHNHRIQKIISKREDNKARQKRAKSLQNNRQTINNTMNTFKSNW